MSSELIVGFNGGEVSRNIESRIDLPIYKRSASIVENFDVGIEGGVKNRAGTRFLGFTKGDSAAGDAPCHFLPFSYSDGYSYQLEMGNGYIRIWNVQTKTVIQTITTDVPYIYADIPSIQIHRSFNIMYFAHGSYPEYQLTRTSITTFEWAAVEYEFPPMLDQNDDKTLTLYADAQRGTGVTLTASDDLFLSTMVGGYFLIKQDRQASYKPDAGFAEFGWSVPLSLSGTANSIALFAGFSKWRLRTGGTWTGKVIIEITYDGYAAVNAATAVWETLHVVANTTGSAAENFVFDYVNRPKAGAFIRVAFTGASGTLTGELYVDEIYNYGLVKVTGVTSGTVAECTVLNDLYRAGSGYASHTWSEGAFSEKNGYPRTVAIFEDRHWLCGSDTEPCMLWGSVTDDWLDFQIGTNDDEGIRRLPPVNGSACWLASKESLFLCTDNELMVVAPTSTGSGLTGSNLRFIIQNGFGSEYQQNLLSNDVILFVDKGRRKLREVIFNDTEANFRANDLSALSKHITNNKIAFTSIQKLPDQRANTVLENGQLGILTYERTEEVVAWQRYLTDGSYISSQSVQNGENDATWYCIERDGVYMVEEQITRDEDTYWFLDSAVEKISDVACQIADSIDIGGEPDYRVIVTKTAHGLENGDLIRFKNVVGFDYLDGNTFAVADKTADTFVLKSATGVDSAYINPYLFNMSYIDGFNAGTEEMNTRYLPDYSGEYGTLSFQKEVDDGLIVVEKGREWSAEDISLISFDAGYGDTGISALTNIGAWDVSDDGLNLYVVGQGATYYEILHYTMTTAYDYSGMSLEGTITTTIPKAVNRCVGLKVLADGSELWMLWQSGNNIARIKTFALSPAFDVTGASVDQDWVDTYAGVLPFILDLFIDPNGGWFIFGHGNGWVRVNMDTALDLSSTSGTEFEINNIAYFPHYGFTFSPDGMQLFDIHGALKLYHYNLTSPYDITTIGTEESVYDVGAAVGFDVVIPRFSDDGSLFFCFDVSASAEEVYVFDTNIFPSNTGWTVGKYLTAGGWSPYYSNTGTPALPPKDGWATVYGANPPIEFSYPSEFDWEASIQGIFCKIFLTVENLDHLIGKTVTVLTDYQTATQYDVETATLELMEGGTAALVGIPYVSTLSPLPIELVDQIYSIGRQKSIVEASVKLKDSRGGKYGTDLNSMEVIRTRTIEDPIGQGVDDVNDDVTVYALDSWENIKRVYIQQDQPFRFEVLSMSMDVRAKGR